MSMFQWLSTYIWTDPNINDHDIYKSDEEIISDDSSEDESTEVNNDYKDGDYKFVLCKNNKVLGYTDSVDNIPKLIRKYISEDKYKHGAGYIYSVIDKHPGILLTGRAKNSIISYDRVLSRYSFTPVRKL